MYSHSSHSLPAEKLARTFWHLTYYYWYESITHFPNTFPVVRNTVDVNAGIKKGYNYTRRINMLRQ
jgi:hypothetical protein